LILAFLLLDMSSPTVPTANQSESDVLDVRAEVWQKRPLLRQIYHRYFAEMIANFATSDSSGSWLLASGSSPNFGTVLEIGGGAGNFKQYFQTHHATHGRLLATDIVPTPHVDLTADAMALPFPDGSIDNIVMQDVLHHIPYPLKFLAEANRVLRPAGRLVMTEPYISPASRIIFAIGHPEPVVTSAQIFANPIAPGSAGGSPRTHDDPSPLRGAGAFASNQATPTLLFFRDKKKFKHRFPTLKLLARKRRSLFVYPLSGGFSGPKLLPKPLEKPAWLIEKLLTPLTPLLATRLLIVIEKQPLP
jgi:SAM-dependent methyltransferase